MSDEKDECGGADPILNWSQYIYHAQKTRNIKLATSIDKSVLHFYMQQKEYFREAEDGSLVFMGDPGQSVHFGPARTTADGAHMLWISAEMNRLIKDANKRGSMIDPAAFEGEAPPAPYIPPAPPPAAEFIFSALLPKKGREFLLGDMDERFSSDCERFGVERARRRYWASVINSVIPLLWKRTKKIRALAYLEVARKALLG